ncbi:Crp/Fnr family transcriptional regulator [Micromonospora sp. DR5-3]|uniref:Crp/Fnr family transcriptional regulator n=1 Tax=unclassified Micromonospora TaxID=2617518 RepID=UPI0016527C93|nr:MULTISPECIES: Crp/Fnr family transcriptional regulator [unclassified Micromonospora]MCW3814944.1 Crp/Fnr family transcriptional regulator [Micromonospora sp. DR5-3]
MDDQELAAVPLFALLDGACRERIARRHPVQRVPAGQAVARFGEPARSLIVLQHGTLSAGYHTVDGALVRFGAVTGPCLVDKAAVLDAGTHTATWTTVDACRIRLVPGEALHELLHDLPAVRDHVLRQISAQVNRDRRARIRVAAVRPVARVADWLAEAMTGPTRRIVLPGGQQGLGEELGLSRVTVNRALRALAAAGAVRTEPGAVVVLDARRLATAGAGAR